MTYLHRVQERVGKGEFDPAITKVVHFIRNPEAELARQAEQTRISSLQTENEALRAQLSESVDKTPGSDSESLAAAMAKAQIVSLERKVKSPPLATLMPMQQYSLILIQGHHLQHKSKSPIPRTLLLRCHAFCWQLPFCNNISTWGQMG